MDQKNTLSDICAADELSNTCLIHIFSFLPIIDRIRIERVCKRWRTASRRSWETLKCINVTEDFWGIDEDKNEILIDRKILRRTLKRCGQFITHVDLSRESDRHYFDDPDRMVCIQSCRKVFKLIHNACPNIVSINMGRPCADSAIEYVADNFDNLLYFTIEELESKYESAMSKLFSSCQMIKCVNINGGEFSGKCLSNLNTNSVEELLFDQVSADESDLGEALERLDHLKKLTITGLKTSKKNIRSDPVLKGMCVNKEKLEILKINNSFECLAVPDYPYIKQLINLEQLYIRKTDMAADDVLQVFADNCQNLTKIFIHDSSNVTDKGIAAITSQPNLKCLHLDSLNKVTDKVLGNALSLQELLCRGCCNVKNEGIAELIYKSRCIESIKLYGCNVSANYLKNLATYSALSKLKVEIRQFRDYY